MTCIKLNIRLNIKLIATLLIIKSIKIIINNTTLKEVSKMKKLVALMLVGAVTSTAALAGTATDTFNINVTVDPYCEVVNSATDINVAYNPFDTSNTTASTVTDFNCVKETSYTINATGTSLTGALYGDTLTYNLSLSNTGGVDSDGLAGTESTTITVTIPAGQDVSVDTYSATVTVDITY